MKVIEFKEFGGPSKLQPAERPLPQADANTAVVRVKAASVNPSDVKNVAGRMSQTTLPRIPGRDYSGVVVDGPKKWINQKCGAQRAMSDSPETARMPSTSRSLSLAWFASPKRSRTNKPLVWGHLCYGKVRPQLRKIVERGDDRCIRSERQCRRRSYPDRERSRRPRDRNSSGGAGRPYTCCKPSHLRCDVFVLKPVEDNNTGFFEDHPDAQQTTWGSYFTIPAPMLSRGMADLYYMELATKNATYNRGSATELRQTAGVRAFRPPSKGLDYNWEASPMLRADVYSGDVNPTGNTFATYNSFFPRGAYFTPKAIPFLGPQNLVDLHPMMQFRLRRNITGEGPRKIFFCWMEWNTQAPVG
jgi:Alcohol dehydrogenase GroES-like domain